MRNYRQDLVLLLALAALAAGGCTTTSDVREIVAQSNAAMVSPFLDKPGNRANNDWKEPVAQIDQLILQNADQPTLVNHLRVRQAMLLTVFQQGNLARERWSQIDPDALQTERDKGLYQSRDALVWWYRRAPVTDPLDSQEKSQANGHIAQLTTTLGGVQDTDVRVYLGTIRAQIAHKLANDADVSSSDLKQQVRDAMARDLAMYVALFTPEDQAWVRENAKTNLSEGMSIADFRRRVWLREMIRDFRATAAALELSPTWTPEWVGTLDVN